MDPAKVLAAFSKYGLLVEHKRTGLYSDVYSYTANSSTGQMLELYFDLNTLLNFLSSRPEYKAWPLSTWKYFIWVAARQYEQSCSVLAHTGK
jgi:hypothetical protein